jgi:hypothetical protein
MREDTNTQARYAQKMLQLWARFSGEVSVVVADNTTATSDDPSTGHGEVAAAWSLARALSFQARPVQLYFSNQVAQQPGLTERLLRETSVICLGAADTNCLTRLVGEQTPLPFVHHDERRDSDPPGRSSRHRLEYQGQVFETEYAVGQEGDPNAIVADYGVAVCLPSPAAPARWTLLCVGCHTFGTKGAIAALCVPQVAGVVVECVGNREFSLLVRVTGMDTPGGDVRVQVLAASDPRIPERTLAFLNSRDLVEMSEVACLPELNPTRDFDPAGPSATEIPFFRRLRVSGFARRPKHVIVTVYEGRIIAAQTVRGRHLDIGSGTPAAIRTAYHRRECREATTRLPLVRADYGEDAEWAASAGPILKGYAGRYVAVVRKEIVASHETYLGLLGELDRLGRLGDQAYVHLCPPATTPVRPHEQTRDSMDLLAGQTGTAR